MGSRLFLKISTLLLLLGLAAAASAANAVYSVPPPNDTSLQATPPQVGVRPHHQHQHHYYHRQKRCSKILVHRSRHRPQQHAGIYLYYPLPATACCGETWQLNKTRCCAEEGVWPRSPYATFKPAPADFIRNASNDDETRPYDYFSDVPVDDSVEDPE